MYKKELLLGAYKHFMTDVKVLEEHHSKYSLVMDQLSPAKTDKQILLNNILLQKPVSVENVSQCVTETNPTIQLFLEDVLAVQTKLSYTNSTTVDSYQRNIEAVRDNTDNIIICVQNLKHSQSLSAEEISKRISESLSVSDISLVGDLISYAQLSDILTLLGTHHTLIGILGVPLFCYCCNSLEESGTYEKVLKGVYFKLYNVYIFQQVKYVYNSNLSRFTVVASTVIVMAYNSTWEQSKVAQHSWQGVQDMYDKALFQGTAGKVISNVGDICMKTTGSVGQILHKTVSGFFITFLGDKVIAIIEILKRK